MRNFKLLFRLQFNQYLRLRLNTADKKQLVMPILVIASFALVAVLIAVGLFLMTGLFVKANMVSVCISILLTVCQCTVIIFGTMSFISIMYYSRDSQFFMTLPVSNKNIYLSKILIIYIQEAILSVGLGIIMFASLTAGLLTNGVALSASYYLYLIFALITLPFLPLMIIMFISYPVMKLINAMKSKPVLAAIVGMIFMGICLVAYFMIIGGGSAPDVNTVGSISWLGSVNLINKMMADGLLGIKPLLNLGVPVLVYLTLAVASYFVGGIIFKKSSTFMTENSAANLKADKAVVHSALASLIRRDFKLTVRETSLLINLIMPVLLAPIMIFVMTSGAMGNISTGTGENPANFSSFAIGISLYMSMLIGGMNYGAVIAISREGKSLAFLRTLPINSATFIKSKLIVADILSYSGILLSAIVLLINGIPFFDVVLFVAVTAINASALGAFGLINDCKRPKLDWINYKQLVNRNMNLMKPVFTALLIGLASMIAFIMISGTVLVWWRYMLAWMTQFLVSLVLFFIFRYKCVERAAVLYDKIDVS